MATILTRKRKDGSPSYLVQIVRRRNGVALWRENRTFDNKRQATAWARERETEIDAPGAIDHLLKPDGTLADAIGRHLHDLGDRVGRSKRQTLLKLKTYPIADMPFGEIKSTDIVSLAKQIAATGALPQTVNGYISELRTMFEIARRGYGFKVDPDAMGDALYALKKAGAVSKSAKRDRRPTLAELDAILGHFRDRTERSPHSAPMVDIVLFALFSSRRLEEITRIRWADLEPVQGGQPARVMVRDMKHPGFKSGNDVWTELPPEAEAVIMRQPRVGERIFPYSRAAIIAGFARACKFLGIDDLHFHDLRHEAISRLFEAGWSIPRTAVVSGHRSWSSLQRYAQVRQKDDKFSGWRWRPS